MHIDGDPQRDAGAVVYPAVHGPYRMDAGAEFRAEPPLIRAQATLRGFDGGSYTATIQLARGPDLTLSGVPVSRAVPAAEMVSGRALAVLFFDQANARDAMVVGVW